METSYDCTENAGIAREIAVETGRGPAPPRDWRVCALSSASAQELVALMLAPVRVKLGSDLDEAWLAQHARAAVPELSEQLGVPSRAALRLACAFELGRRAATRKAALRAPIRTPGDVHRLLHGMLEGRDRESVVALYLDGRHRLLQLHEVSVGTATASLIHPREVFGPALRARACAVVVAHNHPSGDPEPSGEDRSVTERLIAAGELVGVPLLDHVVVGGDHFVSLRGTGSWPHSARQARL